jgi:hypothetical protein
MMGGRGSFLQLGDIVWPELRDSSSVENGKRYALRPNLSLVIPASRTPDGGRGMDPRRWGGRAITEPSWSENRAEVATDVFMGRSLRGHGVPWGPGIED